MESGVALEKGENSQMEELCPLSGEEDLPQFSLKNSHYVSLTRDEALRSLRGPADDFLIYEDFLLLEQVVEVFPPQATQP